MLLSVGLVLLRGEPRADEGAGNVAARLVGQLHALAQDAAGHGDGALAKGLLLLLAEAVEVLLLLDLLPHHRLLDILEVGVQRANPGRRVDVHHGRDSFRDAVAGGVAGEAGRAVNGEDDRGGSPLDRLDDCVDMVGHRDRRTVGVGGLESGERDCGDVVTVGAEHRGNFVPGPGAQPKARNQDDRCGVSLHFSHIAPSGWLR
jgi:hypothetical protein